MTGPEIKYLSTHCILTWYLDLPRRGCAHWTENVITEHTFSSVLDTTTSHALNAQVASLNSVSLAPESPVGEGILRPWRTSHLKYLDSFQVRRDDSRCNQLVRSPRVDCRRLLVRIRIVIEVACVRGTLHSRPRCRRQEYGRRQVFKYSHPGRASRKLGCRLEGSLNLLGKQVIPAKVLPCSDLRNTKARPSVIAVISFLEPFVLFDVRCAVLEIAEALAYEKREECNFHRRRSELQAPAPPPLLLARWQSLGVKPRSGVRSFFTKLFASQQSWSPLGAHSMRNVERSNFGGLLVEDLRKRNLASLSKQLQGSLLQAPKLRDNSALRGKFLFA